MGVQAEEDPAKEALFYWGEPLGGTDKISFSSNCFYRSAPGAMPQALRSTKGSGGVRTASTDLSGMEAEWPKPLQRAWLTTARPDSDKYLISQG